MTTCTACGSDVTGKKFCPQCGTAVQPLTPSITTCPRCNGEVNPGAAFCMHCGAPLKSQAAPQPVTLACPACHTVQPAQTAFCTNCGHNMHEAAPAQSQYQQPQYPQSQYPQPQYSQPHYPQSQYGQPQYAQPQYQQPYDPYTQGNYQSQPMLGQAPMVLRCPTCMSMSPSGTSFCQNCRTNLAGVVPTPATMQGQQGGFMQGNAGKFAMGALGGAAAVIGGEMLLNGVENVITDRREDDRGYNHHHREEGLLGGLDDIGLF